MDDLVAPPPDLVGDQVGRHDLAKVAEVDGARGAEARGADDGFARGAALRLGNDLVREP